jgi:hypothetical protein
MREDTIGRKKASRLFQQLRGRRWLLGRMLEVISEGKRGLDGLRGRFTGSGLALHCDNVLLQDLTLRPREKADEIIAAVRGLDNLPKIATLPDLLVP